MELLPTLCGQEGAEGRCGGQCGAGPSEMCTGKSKVSVENAVVELAPGTLVSSTAGFKAFGVVLLLQNTDLCMVMLNS